MPTHDDLLLEGHDAGFDGEGLCPNCQEPIDESCICCATCHGDGRVRRPLPDDSKVWPLDYQICTACDGWGIVRPKDEIAADTEEKPL